MVEHSTGRRPARRLSTRGVCVSNHNRTLFGFHRPEDSGNSSDKFVGPSRWAVDGAAADWLLAEVLDAAAYDLGVNAPARRYPKGEAKRAEILHAALDVLEREGEAGSSLRNIAKEAGISLAGLVHHFPTRDVLFTELLRELDRAAAETFFSGTAGEDPGLLLAAAMRGIAERPVHGILYVTLHTASLKPGHPAAPYFAERYDTLRVVFSDYVRRLQGDGEVGADRDADYIAAAILAAADGIRFQWQCDHSVDMPAHVLRTWDFLLGRPPAGAAAA